MEQMLIRLAHSSNRRWQPGGNLGPILTGLMIAARVAAGITARSALGNRRAIRCQKAFRIDRSQEIARPRRFR
jgi:hypothetical protein